MGRDGWPDWQIFVDYGCVCVYCGFDGTTDPLAWRQLVIDHLVPRQKGGLDVPENKVVACCICNNIKGGSWDKTYDGSVPLTEKTKPQLIASAKQRVQEHHQRWMPDFEPMMAEIRARKFEGASAN
jgi:5-methylcytosine-specific restriction endonuclease McrA